MPKIQVQNITKRFNDRLVLDNVSFSIEKGEIFGLIGPNGAGKSTLLNIIIGLLKANSGQVLIDDKTIEDNSVEYKTKIGFVPQELAILEELTVFDNLEYFGGYYGLFGKALKDRIRFVLEHIGLEGQQKKKVKKLSGGFKRRLNIALALLHEPEVLILDEPAVGIDTISRGEIFSFIKRLSREEQVTVIFTSHHMDEIEQLCQQIFIIDQGKKVTHGTKEEIKSLFTDGFVIQVKTNLLPSLFVNELKILVGVKEVMIKTDERLVLLVDSTFQLDALIQICHQHQVKLIEINFKKPSLEEVFLALTGRRWHD